jgi:hypothetical protein
MAARAERAQGLLQALSDALDAAVALGQADRVLALIDALVREVLAAELCSEGATTLPLGSGSLTAVKGAAHAAHQRAHGGQTR